MTNTYQQTDIKKQLGLKKKSLSNKPTKERILEVVDRMIHKIQLDEEMYVPKVGAWQITLPPAEGGKPVRVDTSQVLNFIKSKGGSEAEINRIKKGKHLTFQSKTGAVYTIYHMI